MVIEPARTGYLGEQYAHPVDGAVVAPTAPGSRRVQPAASPPPVAPPAALTSPSSGRAPKPPVGTTGIGAPSTAPTPPPADPVSEASAAVKPVERGLKRLGASRFISGTRRR